MPSVPIKTDSTTHRPYTKRPGLEPLPGYVLIEPLGRGGFGEVWKCRAPGGLLKAVKFVASGETDAALQQELAAFEEIKAIRHPFLLTLERVELLGNELVMVMELADNQLQDRFRECVSAGSPGIPRQELLGYFADAAEALDVISERFGLQHLDVKPANLFLTAGRVKVGDYGLVSNLKGGDTQNGLSRGLTPKYVAPEVLNGSPSPRSDQYSLALVYQELLSGTFAYPARTAQQLMIQHVVKAPDLSGLPECDRPAVGRALAKNPEERFASCLDFVRALLAADPKAGENPLLSVRRARLERTTDSSVVPTVPNRPQVQADSAAGMSTHTPAPVEQTQAVTVHAVQPITVRSQPMPPLVAPASTTKTPPPTGPENAGPEARPPGIRLSNKTPPPTGPENVLVTPPPISTRNNSLLTPAAFRDADEPDNPRRPASLPSLPPPATRRDEELPLVDEAGRVILTPVRSVVTVSRLTGSRSKSAKISAGEFVAAVVDAAAAGAHVPQLPGDLGRLADGTWVCQFPSTVPASVAPHKLCVVGEQWGTSLEVPEPTRIVIRKTVGGGGLWGALGGGKKSGMEVVIQLPSAGKSLGEITVTGGLFGTPDGNFARSALDMIPKIITAVRRELGNVEDRRKHPRVAAPFALSLYAIHSSGGIDPPVAGRCKDVSRGGIGFTTPSPIRTKYVYAVFEEVKPTAGLAILVRLSRRESPLAGQEHTYGGHFRTDL